MISALISGNQTTLVRQFLLLGLPKKNSYGHLVAHWHFSKVYTQKQVSKTCFKIFSLLSEDIAIVDETEFVNYSKHSLKSAFI
jgi:hypothetical protein